MPIGGDTKPGGEIDQLKWVPRTQVPFECDPEVYLPMPYEVKEYFL
jgi:hypothetical protein